MKQINFGARLFGRRASGEVSAVQYPEEMLLVRALRGLRSLAQLGRMLGEIFGHTAGAQVSESETTPSQYRELVSVLELPDRPMPLTRFERAVPGEASLVARMARAAANAVATNFCAMKRTGVSLCAMRDQHAKAHGCVKAEFVVSADLPADFTTPLFRRGARYPAILRFSNGQGQPKRDNGLDGRGISIKLREVDGQTVLRGLVPERTAPREHDFLLGSFPVFFCKGAVDYVELMDAVNAPGGSWREKLSKAGRWLWFVVRHPQGFVKFIRSGLVFFRNPLTGVYHSMAPYLFGEDKVVRYIVGPAQRKAETEPWWIMFDSSKPANYLQDALVRDLTLVAHDPGRRVVLDFSVRVRDAAGPEEAEDASLWWTRPQDRVVRLATIEIPAQDFLAPDWVYDCEHLMFSPWNCLQQHRPLGSINRMRLAVYLASLQVRRKLNMVGS